MSRSATIHIIYESDLTRPRRAYDEFRQYVEANPIHIRYEGGPGGAAPGGGGPAPGGGGLQTVRTFGGGEQQVSAAPFRTTMPSAPGLTRAPIAGGVAMPAPPPGVIINPRPAEQISADISRSIQARDDAARQRYVEELAQSYGTTPAESRGLVRQRQDYQRQLNRFNRQQDLLARRAAQVEARQETIDERYDVRYERRLASDQQRAQRLTQRAETAQESEAERIARIDRSTARITARGAGGARGELGAVETQIDQLRTLGGGATDIANLQRRRAQLLNQITAEEQAAHRRNMTAQEQQTQAAERRSRSEGRAVDQQRRARLDLDLARTPDRAAQIEVLNRAARQYPRDSAQQLRLQARAARLQRQGEEEEEGGGPGGGGAQRFLGLRLGRVGQLATIGIIAHEVLRIGQAGIQRNVEEELAHGNQLGIARANLGYAQNLASVPLVGQAADLLLSLGNYVSRGKIPSIGAAQLAIDRAERGVQAADYRSETIRLRRVADIENRDLERRSTAAVLTRTTLDPTQRPIVAAESARDEAREAVRERVREQATQLNEEYKNENDPTNRARILERLRAVVGSREIRRSPTREPFWTGQLGVGGTGQQAIDTADQAAERVARADQAVARLEQVTNATETALRTTAARAAHTGSTAASARFAARAQLAQYLPIFVADQIASFGAIDETTPAGRAQAGALRASYREQVEQGRINEQRDRTLTQGTIRAMQAELRNDPFGAQAERNTAARNAAYVALGIQPTPIGIAAARIRADVATRTGLTAEQQAAQGITPSWRLDEIEQQFTLAQGLNERDRRRFASLTAFNQVQTERSLRRQLARDPVGAEAIDFTTRGIDEAVTLQRTGFTDRAQSQLRNTALGLDVLRQNYLFAFRGEQVNLRQISTQGPRDVQDPNEVLREIAGLQRDMPRLFAEALTENLSK